MRWTAPSARRPRRGFSHVGAPGTPLLPPPSVQEESRGHCRSDPVPLRRAALGRREAAVWARRGRAPTLRADQIDHADGNDEIDWLVPIVADAEAGFGGHLNVFELTKAMIAAGAAGVHLEDQMASEKKCGHMGGKVLLADLVGDPQPRRRAAGRRRLGRRDRDRRPHRRRRCRHGDQRRRRARPRVPHRRAHRRGLLPLQREHRAGDRARHRLRALRRPRLVRDVRARPRAGRSTSRARCTRSIRGSCSPTTARRRSTGRASSTTTRSPASSSAWGNSATRSSSSRSPGSTRSTTRCSSSRAATARPG
jgi:Isocitrate lyase family